MVPQFAPPLTQQLMTMQSMNTSPLPVKLQQNGSQNPLTPISTISTSPMMMLPPSALQSMCQQHQNNGQQQLPTIRVPVQNGHMEYQFLSFQPLNIRQCFVPFPRGPVATTLVLLPQNNLN